MNNDLRHLGIIPDGGGRWARREGVALDEAYRVSLGRLGQFCHEWYLDGITTISIYLLSKSNLKRPKEELQSINTAGIYFFQTVLPPIISSLNVSVRLIGRTELLPSEMFFHSIPLPNSREGNTRRLYLLVAYDPFDELEQAFTNFMKNGTDLMQFMWVPEPVDLVIRSGGATTLSRFLPLQASYANLCFRSELFNDLTFAVLNKQIERFRERDLQFGD